MLTVRTAQLAAFQQARTQGFVDHMLVHLANEYPRNFSQLAPDQARALIDRTLVAAAQWGIKTQGAIGVLAELRLVYGEKLERAPDRQWAMNLLAHPTLPDYIKVGAVQERLSQRAGGRVVVMHQAPT